MTSYDPTTIFYSQKDAIAFLRTEGFKISTSKFSADFRKGLIPCSSDKSFVTADLIQYAQSGLKVPTPFKLEKNEQKQRIQAAHKELKGLATGIVLDGKVVQQEALFLLQWLDNNAELAENVPSIKRLHNKARVMLEDDTLSTKEGEQLLDIIHRLIIPDFPKQEPSPTHSFPPKTKNKKNSSKLYGADPYQSNKPLQLIEPRDDIFDDIQEFDPLYKFCFTGIFAFGDRKACYAEMCKKGTHVDNTITKYHCYLVVGSLASPDWKHGNYGRKIEKALGYKSEGGSIKIIHEDTWAKALCDDKEGKPRKVINNNQGSIF